MRYLATIVAVSLVANLGLAAAQGDEETDEKRIVGTWQLVSKTQKGVETKIDAKSEESSDDIPLCVTFEEQDWRTEIGPKGAPIEIKGSYVLDSKQTPKLLDITVRSGGDSNSVYAIYKFENDQLFIRLRENNGTRPTDFETPAMDCLTLVLKREAK